MNNLDDENCCSQRLARGTARIEAIFAGASQGELREIRKIDVAWFRAAPRVGVRFGLVA
jgi:hypothetical protein